MCEIIDAMGESSANNFSGIRYVFLDRDGVLNRSLPDGRFVTCWEQVELLPGIAEAIARLNRSGRKVIVVTNQRAVALGLCSETELLALHDRLRECLASQGAHLDAIYYCPHDVGECNCRKPLPGLFEQAFRDFPDANPGNSVMIGDSLSDMEAGARLGMRTIFIAADHARPMDATSAAVPVARSLEDCVQRYFCRGCSNRDS